MWRTIAGERAVIDRQDAIVANAAALAVARDILSESAVIDRQRPAVADGATVLCAISGEGTVDDRHGAARAVVDGAAVAQVTHTAGSAISAEDAVDDRHGGEAVIHAATVALSTTIAHGHL